MHNSYIFVDSGAILKLYQILNYKGPGNTKVFASIVMLTG